MHPLGTSICFNVIKYIRLEKLAKLNKNAYKKITYLYFNDFYINYYLFEIVGYNQRIEQLEY